MADDTEEPVLDQPAPVATQEPPAPAPEPAPAEVDHGRAMGFSQRGSQVPRGTDTTAAPPPPTPEPVGSFQGSPYQAPTPSLAANRAERRAAARSALLDSATQQWKSDYSAGRNVPGNGPRISEKQYRAAETAAEAQASEEAAQARQGTREANATAEAQMRASGQRYYVDPAGNVQPMREPGSGRNLYKQTPWEEGVHPQTGETTLTKMDQYGQRQYKRPQMVAPSDPSDNQMYYRLPDNTLAPAGDIDELTKHKDPQVARMALRAVHSRNSAMWNEALTPMKEAHDQAVAAHETAQQQSVDLQTQINGLSDQMKSIDPVTLAKTVGGEPTAAATAEINKQNSLTAQIDALNKEKEAIDATTARGGSLELARRNAQLNLGIFKAKASHDSYVDLATERRQILAAQGKPEKDDPILANILQAQKIHADAIGHYTGVAQREAAAQLPRVSHDELLRTSGDRLPVGAAVPGQPGLYESAKDEGPVWDSGLPKGQPSKYTMVGDTSPSAPAKVATPSQPQPPGATPTASAAQAGKPDQALASEPFALMQRGVKNIGEVPIMDIARRYGTGNGPVSPNSLIKIKSRVDDITKTLEDPNTQLDGKVREGMQKEQEYLQNLTTQRFARLSPEDQKRVTEITRDPTFWDKVKGAGKSAAEAAASGGASVMKGLQIISSYVPTTTRANPLDISSQERLDEIRNGPLYRLGSFIQDAAKDTYSKNPHEDEGMVSQAINAAAEGAGGFAPLVASGAAAPLTIGLQTAGGEMESFYNDAISKGMTKDQAASRAVNRALASGAVQTAIFEVLPKPLQKMATKLIVDKLAKSALTRFIANRGAQAAEGFVLGGTSAAGGNIAAGRPVGEGVLPAAAGLGALQAVMARPGSERPPMAPTDVSPQDAARAELNAKLAPQTPTAPVEPFKPTGEGLPKSAAESAKTLVPEAGKLAAEVPPANKSAEESANVFKANEKLNKRAAAKEEAAQKLVDSIQESTGKSRGEILATRAGKDIDQWHDELKKEAAYQKNPLVVDPERRSEELREDIKRLDAEWQDHLTKTSQEAEAAAAIQESKGKGAAEHFAAIKQGAIDRHNALQERKTAIEDELNTAERLRQSPQGAKALKTDLALERKRAEVTAAEDTTGKTKADMIKEAVGTPNATYQYSVFRPGGGIKGMEQVDVIGKGSRPIVSSNPKDLRAAGAKIPEVPDWVPQGKYTQAELEALIKKGDQSNAVTTGEKPSESQHPRAPSGAAIPENREQVRSEKSSGPDGGNRPVGSEKVAGPQGAKPIRAEVVETKHGEVEGDKINKEWTAFAPEAKGTGVPRTEMPQVLAEHRGALVQFLKGKGIEHKPQMVRPTDLKPTQAEYSPAKVDKARKYEGGDRSILVSSDNHVLDGHHQWMAALTDHPERPMKVIKLDAPIDDLLPAVREFPSAETAKGAPTSEAGASKETPAPGGEPSSGTAAESAGGQAKETVAAKEAGGKQETSSRREIADQRRLVKDLQDRIGKIAAKYPEKAGPLQKRLANEQTKLADLEARKGTGATPKVGYAPTGESDILSDIADHVGSISTKGKGGEADDMKGVLQNGAARLLRSENGTPADEAMAILNDTGKYKFTSTAEMADAVSRAVEDRRKAGAKMKTEEYQSGVESAALGGERKPGEKAAPAEPVEKLGVGAKFKIRGENFSIVDVEEQADGTYHYVIQDGHKFKVPEGTMVYPDYRSVKDRAKASTDFLPEGEAAQEAPSKFVAPKTERQADLLGEGDVEFTLAGEKQKENAGQPTLDERAQSEADKAAAEEKQTKMPEVSAKKSEPEPTVTAPESTESVDLKNLNESKLAALAAQLGVDPKGMSGERLRARIESNAHPDDIREAIANPTKQEEPKSKSQKLIDALNNAKIHKPGQISAATPLSIAYDGALDLAILGVKAGRELAHMIELAVKRFKAAYPQATSSDVAKLKGAIETAHASANSKPAEEVRATPEQKAEATASAVISSPQAEEARTKIGKMWNEAKDKGNIKETIAATNDAAENAAKTTAREAYTTVSNQLLRDVGKDQMKVAADALGFHVEAGKETGLDKLAEMRAKIEGSTKADPKWKARALAAIDFARDNYAKLQKTASLFRAFTETQQAREEANGMPTLRHDNYVPHMQDVEDGTWLENLLGTGGGGMSTTGASSRKNRVFETHADSIAAGIDPKTLNALDLLHNRISAGETGVNLRQWQQSLHNYVDAKTGQPIVMKAVGEPRADGTTYYKDIRGYKNQLLGNTMVSVHKGYDGIVSAMTDPSWWAKDETRKVAQKLNGAGKSINLLIDTFHLGRLAMRQSILKAASLSDMRLPKPSFREGLNILDRSADEMRTMARNGEIAPEALPDLLEKKKNLGLLTAAGLNTGHVSDAMHQEIIRSIPVVGDINKFIFEKFQRGAMAETALMEFDRQRKSFSDLSDSQVARNVARDINTRFGNIGKQGWFKSRTARDSMRMIALAPQWNEGLIKSEVGGVRQLGESIVNAARGKRFAMGALGRDMITGAIGIFAANQIINQMTRGKFTWQNPEEEWGAKLSAWIPDKAGKNSSGYFLNPLGVTAEISHLLLTRYERTHDKWQPFIDFGRSRLSAAARPVYTFVTREDGLGNKVRPEDRMSATGKAAIPVPIGASAAFQAAKGAIKGGNQEVFPGQYQKQAMQSIGIKTDTAPSPETRIGSLATEFNRTKNIKPNAEYYAGDYTDLTAALRRNNQDDIKDELSRLLEKKPAKDVQKHFQSLSRHPFTGQKSRETEFIRTLNAEQRSQYVRAQRSRQELGQRALQALSRMPHALKPTGTD